jgi:hypothetical protein
MARELLRGDGIGDEREDEMITIDGVAPRSLLPVGAVEGAAEAPDVGA